MKRGNIINADYYKLLRQKDDLTRSIATLEKELATVKNRMSAIEAELKKYGVTIC